MPTRNVVLTEHQSAFLDRLVASGRYQNASEAMRDGLRRLEDLEEDRRVLSDYFDQLLKEAEDPTGSRPAEEVFDELRSKLRNNHAAE